MKIITAIIITTISLTSNALPTIFSGNPNPDYLGTAENPQIIFQRNVSEKFYQFGEEMDFMSDWLLVKFELSKKGYNKDTNQYEVEFIIPGLKEEDLKISMTGVNLRIKAPAKSDVETQTGKLMQHINHVEEMPSKFSQDTITYEYNSPILKIFLKP